MKLRGRVVATGFAFGAAVFAVARLLSSPQGRMANLAEKYLRAWQHADEETQRAMIRGFWLRATGAEGASSDPWSGAFVVSVANQAVPGSLALSAKHTTYIQAAMKDPRWVVLPAGTVRPQRGDIILKPRPGGTESFQDLFRPEGFSAHADIVTRVDRDTFDAIGGNKAGGAIAGERYPLSSSGTPTAPAIALLRFLGA